MHHGNQLWNWHSNRIGPLGFFIHQLIINYLILININIEYDSYYIVKIIVEITIHIVEILIKKNHIIEITKGWEHNTYC